MAEHNDWTARLGRLGVWGHAEQLTPTLARELESLGYGTVWLGGSPAADLAAVDEILAATERITVATGIVNIWTADAATAAGSYHRIERRFPGRFLLGIGAGHPEAQGAAYRRPYEALVAYLDVLDAEGVPDDRRLLAALGPRVLRLAAERSAGAHPYLVTAEHTREARQTLGPAALLAPEHKAVLDTDAGRARAVARPRVEKPYLSLSNYLKNLRRLGFGDRDFADGGSDRLIDALVAHGDAHAVATGLGAHLDAGADHVTVQLITPAGADPRPGYRAIAEAFEQPEQP